MTSMLPPARSPADPGRRTPHQLAARGDAVVPDPLAGAVAQAEARHLLRGCDALGMPSIPALLDRLFDLGVLHRADLILREKAVGAFQAFGRGSGARLFFNLDPRVLDSADDRAERTRDLLDRHGMDAASLCFELSESHALTPESSPERMLTA